MATEKSPFAGIRDVLGLSSLTKDAAATAGKEEIEGQVKKILTAEIEKLARQGQSGSALVKNFLKVLDPIRKSPIFSLVGNSLAGIIGGVVQKLPTTVIDPLTKRMLAEGVKHIMIGATSGLSEVDLTGMSTEDFHDMVEDKVDSLAPTVVDPKGGTSFNDPVITSEEFPQSYHELALDALGKIIYDKDGIPQSPCPLWADFVATWKREHKSGVKIEGQGKNRRSTKVDKEPVPWEFKERWLADRQLSPCRTCAGSATEIAARVAAVPIEKRVKTFDQASPVLIKVHVAVINAIADRMRGTTSLSFTSVKYKNFEKFMEAVNNPSTIRNVQVLEEMARQIEPSIQDDGSLPEDKMIRYITALDVSGAELKPFQEWKSTILSLFTDDDGGDQVATRRKQFIWAWIKRFFWVLLIAVFLLILPWLATMAGLTGTAIFLALVLGLPLSFLLFPVKIVEAVLDKVTEIAAGKDLHWGVNDARGIAWAIVLNMVLCVFINLADFAMFGRVIMLLVAMGLSFWMYSAKSSKKIGIIPMFFALMVMMWCANFAMTDTLRESAEYPVTVAWQAKFAEDGTQVNTLVVPLPSGRVEPAELVFNEVIFLALSNHCRISDKDRDDKLVQTQVKAQKKAKVIIHQCIISTETTLAPGTVKLAKGTIVNVPGAVVRPVELGNGMVWYAMAETGIKTSGAIDIRLPKDEEGKKLLAMLLVVLILIILGVGIYLCVRLYQNGSETGVLVIVALATTLLSIGLAFLVVMLFYSVPASRADDSSSNAKAKAPVVRVRNKAKSDSQVKRSGLTPTQKALCDNWAKRKGSSLVAKAKYDQYCAGHR